MDLGCPFLLFPNAEQAQYNDPDTASAYNFWNTTPGLLSMRCFKKIFTRECSLRVNTSRLVHNDEKTLPSVEHTESPPIESAESTSADQPSECEEETDESCSGPPLPPEFESLSNADCYTQSAAAHRQLLAEVLPLAVEGGLSRKACLAGWMKSGIAPFSKAHLDDLPVGEPPKKAVRGTMPSISGRLLTAPDTMIEIWSWRLSQIEKMLKTTEMTREQYETIKKEQTKLEEELTQLRTEIEYNKDQSENTDTLTTEKCEEAPMPQHETEDEGSNCHSGSSSSSSVSEDIKDIEKQEPEIEEECRETETSFETPTATETEARRERRKIHRKEDPNFYLWSALDLS